MVCTLGSELISETNLLKMSSTLSTSSDTNSEYSWSATAWASLVVGADPSSKAPAESMSICMRKYKHGHTESVSLEPPFSPNCHQDLGFWEELSSPPRHAPVCQTDGSLCNRKSSTLKQPRNTLGYQCVSLCVKDKPSKEEVFKQKQVTKQKDAIHGVRLGAGDRSYLIRNNRIDVLRNQYGGVEVPLCSSNVAQRMIELFERIALVPRTLWDEMRLRIRISHPQGAHTVG